MKKKETRLEKKEYSHPEIKEHRTLDKAKACSYYARSYNSYYNTYYY